MIAFAENTFIPLDEYIAQCNTHYYGARDSIGGIGDFITAPEITQMFGEVLGAWVISRWVQMGRPTPFQLIELGPGKGTLMADVLRVLRQHPDIYAAVHIHLVETSPKLRAAQKQSLREFMPPVMWHDDIKHIPTAPFILLANEFFDALPIRQFVYTMAGWQERGVRLQNEKLTWASREIPESEPPPLPRHLPTPVPGNMIETCPAMTTVLQTLAARMEQHPASALIIDYGYAVQNYGDTFQAVSQHQYADPLAQPGHQDLTAHVNFAEIEQFGAARGLQTAGPKGQGEFLINIGLQVRAEKLIAQSPAPEDKLEVIEAAYRLTSSDEMGTLFKVICLSSLYLPPPEGF